MAHVCLNNIKMALDVCICIYPRDGCRERPLILGKMEQTPPRLYSPVQNTRNVSKTLYSHNSLMSVFNSSWNRLEKQHLSPAIIKDGELAVS
jgi:hypothetical protein